MAPDGSILTLFHTQYFPYSVTNTPLVFHYEERQHFHKNQKKSWFIDEYLKYFKQFVLLSQTHVQLGPHTVF
jgi:hypothetical protein